MKKQIDHVAKFHDVFQIGNELEPIAVVGEGTYNLRYNLMKEENDEYLDACKDNDLVEIADALGDQLYILCGTILKHGLQHKIEEVFEEIQKSNMSKLDASGNPIFREDGKILKGENYFKPNIQKILDI
jgi:phosphoribosyl-ATP pyrophosphohydrolase